MTLSAKLDRLHTLAKQNKWLRYFSVFIRIALAAGFIPSGIVKILGERFAGGLSVNHPMGHFLEALHHTGYYYTFIGIVQIIAAILLLIPRTVTLGAVLYFPIILNICILSFALRFEGSLLSSPLMVLADLYLLCWNYDKLKFILPFNHPSTFNTLTKEKTFSNKFPIIFFTGVVATLILLVLLVSYAINPKPRNSLNDCNNQFEGTARTKAGCDFCDCIHKYGEPLDSCLNKYKTARDDTFKTP